MQDRAGFTKSVALCDCLRNFTNTRDEGEMPYLELSSAHPSRQAPYCVRLKASDADQPLDVVRHPVETSYHQKNDWTIHRWNAREVKIKHLNIDAKHHIETSG